MASSFDRLPECMKRDDRPESVEIAHILLDWFDAELLTLQTAAADFFWDHLNPNTCKTTSLDWAARFYGFDGEFWDPSWDEEIKRQYLLNFRALWQFRGRDNTFQWLLDLHGLDAKISTQDGWVLGGTVLDFGGNPIDTVVGSAFPIRFGGNPFQYQISIPPRYVESSPEMKLIRKLRSLWLSNAVEVTYEIRATN